MAARNALTKPTAPEYRVAGLSASAVAKTVFAASGSITPSIAATRLFTCSPVPAARLPVSNS